MIALDVPNNRQYSVMLIDDSRIDNFIHQKLLENTNFCRDLRVYRKAEKALKELQDAAYTNEDLIPNLILLDIKMPGMDGFQFLKAFLLFPERVQSKSKVVLLSSYSVKKIELDTLKTGVPSVILSVDKPLIPKDLTEIRKAFARHIEQEFRASA